MFTPVLVRSVERKQSMDKSLLQRIPKVDRIAGIVQRAVEEKSRAVVTDAVRSTIEDLRKALLNGERDDLPSEEEICEEVIRQINRRSEPSLREVINATGVILHTNIGRSCISVRAAKSAENIAEKYSTLEFDIESGKRGSRSDHVENLLCDLTGAESAFVVNNNAAAVLLMLSALSVGGEVVVSRGELVEIGGSFRIPDIMSACGASLREVGTTNKTRAADYAAAINENTKALMKVHTSNYRIVGFSESVSIKELADLGREKNIPVFEDLGSGSLVDLEQFGIYGEPTIQEAVRAGADVVTFSGDKLLGGPQAGILVGKREYIEKLKRHPLARPFRVDKMTLAALYETLRSYAEEKETEEIPVLSMLAQSLEELRGKAERLCGIIVAQGVQAEVTPENDQVGGGSVPTQLLPTFAVALDSDSFSANAAVERLRHCVVPVIARIAHEKVLLCVRTIPEESIDYVARAAVSVVQTLQAEAE